MRSLFFFFYHDDAYVVHVYVGIHTSNTITRALVVVLLFSAVSSVVRCLETAPQCTKDDFENVKDNKKDK